jgi:membrane-bound lytic murein transglycosylase F
MAWRLAAPLAGLLVLASAGAVADVVEREHVDQFSDRYDDHFRKWTKRYFGPRFEWRWFKAQAVVESRLRPNAVGRHGGKGLMQVLPSTYQMLRKHENSLGHIHEPRWNIAAGILYNRMLYDDWESKVEGPEVLKFTLASYNAGPGRIGQARRRAENNRKDPNLWANVEPHAPRITRRYVRHIHDLMRPPVQLAGEP